MSKEKPEEDKVLSWVERTGKRWDAIKGLVIKIIGGLAAIGVALFVALDQLGGDEEAISGEPVVDTVVTTVAPPSSDTVIVIRETIREVAQEAHPEEDLPPYPAEGIDYELADDGDTIWYEDLMEDALQESEDDGEEHQLLDQVKEELPGLIKGIKGKK